MTNRTVHCVFCDDIRHEVGGKVSLMGCYNYSMIFESLPTTLPKLAVAFWLKTAIDKPLKKLTIILQDDEAKTLLEQEWPTDNMSFEPDDGKTILYSGGFGLSHLNIEENTKSIEVLFKTETETLQSQKLKFSVVNVPDRQQVPKNKVT